MSLFEIICNHESHCAKPDRYWRTFEFAEIVDRDGNLIERVIPDHKLEPSDVFACTECGQEAKFKRRIDKKPVKSSRQPAMNLEGEKK